MKIWTLQNSWDEIIGRLEELESFELPFNQRLVRYIKGKWEVCELKKPANFSYQICNHYPLIEIWFGQKQSKTEF